MKRARTNLTNLAAPLSHDQLPAALGGAGGTGGPTRGGGNWSPADCVEDGTRPTYDLDEQVTRLDPVYVCG
jgi:hypothetical protein